MIYRSLEVPTVMGEFPALQTQRDIERVARPNGGSTPAEILEGLCELYGVIGPATVESLLAIKWTKGFVPEAFGQSVHDPNANNLNLVQDLQGHSPLEKGRWHVGGDQGSAYFSRPEILTTSSKWPFSVLVGHVEVDDNVTTDPPPPEFWPTESGQRAIHEAIKKRTLKRSRVAGAGKIVLLHPETLRRDTVPEGATGYRVHIHELPKPNIASFGAFLGRQERFR